MALIIRNMCELEHFPLSAKQMYASALILVCYPANCASLLGWTHSTACIIKWASGETSGRENFTLTVMNLQRTPLFPSCSGPVVLDYGLWRLLWSSLLPLLPPPVAVHFNPRPETVGVCLYHGQVPHSFTPLWNEMSELWRGVVWNLSRRIKRFLYRLLCIGTFDNFPPNYLLRGRKVKCGVWVCYSQVVIMVPIKRQKITLVSCFAIKVVV